MTRAGEPGEAGGMTRVGSALVLGAGIAGLAAATALRQRGVAVDVVERATGSQAHGVGINLPGNALRALGVLGALDEVLRAGFAFDRYRFCDDHGARIVEVGCGLGGEDVPANVAVSRHALHAALERAVRSHGPGVRHGVTADQLLDHADRVDARFSDGGRSSYDLVVGADGVRSSVRAMAFAEVEPPRFSGFGVWRVTVPRPAEVVQAIVYQGVNAKAGFLPLSHEEMYLFLVTPEDGGLRLGASERVEVLRRRLAGFSGLPGRVRDALGPGDRVVYSALDELLVPEPWHRGRVVLIGDAVHACSPHLTQGAAMALEDALVLAEELSAERDVGACLDAFSARRAPRAEFVHAASRAVLDAEMRVTSPEALLDAVETMRRDLPGQLAAVYRTLEEAA